MMRIMPLAPIVRINGSGRDNLVNDYANAKVALDDAIRALAQTAPHPRDYYDQAVFRAAVQQHQERMHQLRQIFADIETIQHTVGGVS